MLTCFGSIRTQSSLNKWLMHGTQRWIAERRTLSSAGATSAGHFFKVIARSEMARQQSGGSQLHDILELICLMSALMVYFERPCSLSLAGMNDTCLLSQDFWNMAKDPPDLPPAEG